MKIRVLSDLHNDADYAKAALSLFKKERFDKLYLLGDLLYDVIDVFNPLHDKILAVRGNCDSYEEIDFARFDRPLINRDYQLKKSIVLTHGHFYNPTNYTAPYDIRLVGHSHQSFITKDKRERIVANPGSLAQPRDGIHSYRIRDDKGRRIRDFDSSSVVDSLDF